MAAATLTIFAARDQHDKSLTMAHRRKTVVTTDYDKCYGVGVSRQFRRAQYDFMHDVDGTVAYNFGNDIRHAALI
jgi:hypothetical protein